MMKQKLLAIASVMALTVLPVAPKAIAQSTPTPGPVKEILSDLNLTPDQQVQVDSIQSLAAAQIKTILTPEQLQRLNELSAAGQADDESLKSLKLTPEQTTKMNEVQFLVAQRLFAVLDAEQQKKLIDALASRQK